MQKLTVFLLQNNKQTNEELKDKFVKEGEFEVIGSSEDPLNALNEISEKQPSFLITELVFSGNDGISVIKNIRAMGVKTKIIVLTSMIREEIITSAMSNGASYFMAKPYNYNLLKERIMEISAENNSTENVSEHIMYESTERRSISLEEKISKIFINAGIPPHIKGYTFLREGVIMAVNDPEIINNVTKKLYPKIGEKYSTTASKVERAIRHAIEVACNRGRIENINSILGVKACISSEKPTNSEFIALIADKLLLEMK